MFVAPTKRSECGLCRGIAITPKNNFCPWGWEGKEGVQKLGWEVGGENIEKSNEVKMKLIIYVKYDILRYVR